MAPLSGIHIKSASVIKLRRCSVELRGLSNVCIQDTLVFLICLMSCGDRQEARLRLFYKINNGLALVPFEDVLIGAYKGTRIKYNMKFRQIGYTTNHSSFALKLLVHGTGLPSLKLRHWL